MNIRLIAEKFLNAFIEKDSDVNLSSAKIYFDDHMLKRKILGFYGFVSVREQKIAYSYCTPILNDDPIDIPKYEQMAKDIEELIKGATKYKFKCVLGASILDNRTIVNGEF
jgi:hypothetical protein